MFYQLTRFLAPNFKMKMFRHDGTQTITTTKNLWGVCPAACWENLYELAAGLLGGEGWGGGSFDHFSSLDRAVPLSGNYTHTHTFALPESITLSEAI